MGELDPVDQTVLANGAGDRRPRLAHRRPGWKSARSRLINYLAITKYADELPGFAGHAPGLARARQDDADELDRQIPTACASPFPTNRRQAREAVGIHTRPTPSGRDLLRGRRRTSSGHPCGKGQSPGSPPSSRNASKARLEADPRDHGQEGHGDGHFRNSHCVDRRKVEVWVGNYVLMG